MRNKEGREGGKSSDRDLSFNLALGSNFNVFPFPQSKSKLIGDVLMNRLNASNMYLFFLFYNAQCKVRRCVNILEQ
jgi:hypothetical protein